MGDSYILISGPTVSMDNQLAAELRQSGEVLRNADNSRIQSILSSRPIELMIIEISGAVREDVEQLQLVRERFPGMPVILVDGGGDREVTVAGFACGVKDAFKKPYKRYLLAERADALLRRQRGPAGNAPDQIRDCGPSANGEPPTRGGRVMKRLLILIVLFTFAAIAAAETIHVPDDYGTIQGAIDAALAGDTIIVAPGTYEENIDFLGKAITVKSELGAEETIIDGSDPVDPDFGSVVTFMSGEGLDSVLDGFTLSYGTGYYNPDMGNTRGGGIAMELSSPTIVNNIINENTAEVGAGIVCDTSSSPVISNNTFTANVGVVVGGGIFCMDGSSPLITGNTFTANKALENGGGAIGCYIYSSPTITNNIFTANVSTGAIASGGAVGVIFYCDPAISNNVFALNSTTNDGGALYFWLSCNPTIENNIITNNSAGDLGGGMYSEDSILTLANNTITGNSAAVGGGGFYLYGNTAATISNTILWDNDAPLGSEGYVGDVDELTISYSDVEGGQESIELVEGATLNWGDGMIDEYPLFAIGPLGDFYLSQIAAGQAEDSPCVGTGDPAGELLWDTTRTDHCLDGLVNMGYHYPQTTVSPVLTCVPSSGTLPFETMMTVSLTNMYTEYGRRLAGQISLMTAGGITIINWRSGWANVGPGGSATAVLSPTLPAHPSLIGTNTVTLGAADMTPAPYNQPPYPPSGDTDTATCTVTGIAP